MSSARLQRPSLIVGAWSALLVGAFVWRGDLRIGSATTAKVAVEPTRAAVAAPNVVRAPAPSTAPGPVSRKGRVFDALGFLVVGAEVVPMARPATRTDGDGEFQVEMPAGATTDLLVRADGQQPLWHRTGDGSPDVMALQLVPAAPWDALPAPPEAPSPLRGEGVVRREDGRPLAAAFVTAAGTGVWTRTDEFGRFVIPLPAPTATLLVHEPGASGSSGFAGTGEPLVNQRPRGIVPVPDLVAVPALAVRGIVRDALGQPVAGLPVEVTGPGLRRLVATGSGGAFHVGGLLPGPCRVRPFAWRGAVGVAHEATLAAAAVDVDLQLVATEERRLQVVDEQGAPVGGVYVASSVGGIRRGVAQADRGGFAAVPVAAATEFDVRTAGHFAPVPVRRFDAEPAMLVVAMP